MSSRCESEVPVFSMHIAVMIEHTPRSLESCTEGFGCSDHEEMFEIGVYLELNTTVFVYLWAHSMGIL